MTFHRPRPGNSIFSGRAFTPHPGTFPPGEHPPPVATSPSVAAGIPGPAPSMPQAPPQADFLPRAAETAACAASIEEGRMNLAEATNIESGRPAQSLIVTVGSHRRRPPCGHRLPLRCAAPARRMALARQACVGHVSYALRRSRSGQGPEALFSSARHIPRSGSHAPNHEENPGGAKWRYLRLSAHSGQKLPSGAVSPPVRRLNALNELNEHTSPRVFSPLFLLPSCTGWTVHGTPHGKPEQARLAATCSSAHFAQF